MEISSEGSVCFNCGGRINMFSDNKKSDSIAYMEAIIEQMEENEKNTNFNIRSYENKDYQSIESMQIFEDIKDTEVTQDFEKIQDIKEQHDIEKIQSFQTNILSKSSSKSFWIVKMI